MSHRLVQVQEMRQSLMRETRCVSGSPSVDKMKMRLALRSRYECWNGGLWVFPSLGRQEYDERIQRDLLVNR